MTLSIHIDVHPDHGDLRRQIEDSMAALGFVRDDHHILKSLSDTLQQGVVMPGASAKPDNDQDYQPGDEEPAMDESVVNGGPEPEEFATPKTQPATPARQRGKPGEGRARRTKAEIAEDEAADAADAAASQAATEAGIQTNDIAAISTGDERISPEDAATEAQDRADEAAEAATAARGLTLDDLRQAVGAYQRKFGIAAAVSDVPAILGCKVVEVPDEKLEWAIGEMAQANALNPYERDVVGGDTKEQLVTPEPEKPAATEAPKTATKDEVVAAMIAYAKKYDGPEANPAIATSMPFANEDFPKLFKLCFGDAVDRLSLVPATPEAYGKALAGVVEMTEKDPFKRGAK